MVVSVVSIVSVGVVVVVVVLVMGVVVTNNSSEWLIEGLGRLNSDMNTD